MNELAVAIAIILFPGLIAAVIADRITFHTRRWGSFKIGMYSFILGTSCYVSLQIIYYSFNLLSSLLNNSWPVEFIHLKVWSFLKDHNTKPHLLETGWATLLSFPVALLASFSVNYKIFNKIARILRVSTKYGDENLFSYYLNSEDLDWVYVRDIENGLTYQGRIDSYSENANMQELVMYDVTIFSYEESDELYSIPSIYLSKSLGHFIIESIPKDLLEEYDEKEENY
jgi:hypothetical protein